MEEFIGKTLPLNEKLIFIDVETANNKGNICQIGAIVCDSGKIVKVIDTTINPQAKFLHDSKHTGLHGLNESAVKDSPTLKEVWEQYFDFYSSDYIFVGHNIKSADSSWLLQDLKRYGINLKCIHCYDTCELSRKYIKKEQYGNADYKLATLCGCLNIECNNLHNAIADTVACFELFNYILKNNEVDLWRFNYPKWAQLTAEEENARSELWKQLNKENNKLKILKEFRKAVKMQNNELAYTLSVEHSPDFTEDIELYKLLVDIPDDAVYTKDEIRQLTEAINKLQEKIKVIKQKIDEF